LAPDHAFGFELADIGRLQSRCSASADALTAVAPSAAGRAQMVTVSGMVLVLLGCRRIAHFCFRRHSGPCPDFPLAQSVANGPIPEVRPRAVRKRFWRASQSLDLSALFPMPKLRHDLLRICPADGLAL